MLLSRDTLKLYDAVGEREPPSGSVNNACHLKIGLLKLPPLCSCCRDRVLVCAVALAVFRRYEVGNMKGNWIKI